MYIYWAKFKQTTSQCVHILHDSLAGNHLNLLSINLFSAFVSANCFCTKSWRLVKKHSATRLQSTIISALTSPKSSKILHVVPFWENSALLETGTCTVLSPLQPGQNYYLARSTGHMCWRWKFPKVHWMILEHSGRYLRGVRVNRSV